MRSRTQSGPWREAAGATRNGRLEERAKQLLDVMPAKAGIHLDLQAVDQSKMDFRFRGNDGINGMTAQEIEKAEKKTCSHPS
jgi:hypothetical protein